jgi:hypothetical protein
MISNGKPWARNNNYWVYAVYYTDESSLPSSTFLRE